MLKELFPEGRFGSPVHLDRLALVEGELGITMPLPLRRLYLECDGFREPTGNAQYLFSLDDPGSDTSLVAMTRFWWFDWKTIASPRSAIDFTPFLFFGSSCCDHIWGIRCNGPAEIIAYHHSMEDKYDVVGHDILDVYRKDYAEYELGGSDNFN